MISILEFQPYKFYFEIPYIFYRIWIPFWSQCRLSLKRVQFWSFPYPIFSSESKYASRTPCIHRINIQIYTHTDKTINITRNKPIKGIPSSLSTSIATSGIEEIEHPFRFQIWDRLKNKNESFRFLTYSTSYYRSKSLHYKHYWNADKIDVLGIVRYLI